MANCRYKYKGNVYTKEEFESFVKEEFVKKSPQNQFLNILAKDGAWITFMTKSIIADSAKKGYTTIRFPKGDTASRVEGHSTLEEFKKEKEDRIKELESKKKRIVDNWMPQIQKEYEKKATQDNIDSIDDEINTLKAELERVEKEGFAALRPIFKFYEETLTNVLNKQGYNPKIVKDKFGNEFNEIQLTPETNIVIQFQKSVLIPSNGEIINNESIKINKDISTSEFIFKTNPEINPYKFTQDKGGYKDVVSRLKSRLITLNIITKDLIIKDNNMFERLQDSWTSQAEKLYSLNNIPKIMTEENGKVKFREYLFEEIDHKNGVINENNNAEDRIKLEEAGLSQQNINNYFNNYFNVSHTYSDNSISEPLNKKFNIYSYIEFINKRQRTNLNSELFNTIADYIDKLNQLALEPDDVNIEIMNEEEIKQRSCKL